MLKKIEVKTKSRFDMINVDSQLKSALKESGIEQGIMLLFVPHTTAAVTINENADSNVVRDMKKALNKIVPENMDYTHAEGNSQAHILSTLTGVSEELIIENGKLVLGTWQSVYFCEYDGPRVRSLLIKIIGG